MSRGGERGHKGIDGFLRNYVIQFLQVAFYNSFMNM